VDKFQGRAADTTCAPPAFFAGMPPTCPAACQTAHRGSRARPSVSVQRASACMQASCYISWQPLTCTRAGGACWCWCWCWGCWCGVHAQLCCLQATQAIETRESLTETCPVSRTKRLGHSRALFWYCTDAYEYMQMTCSPACLTPAACMHACGSGARD
jgi:hypothetical protein